jgi:DNA-3-methyladenine glycosylase
VITNLAHTADGILIRAIEPLDGIPEMLLRRNMNQIAYRIASGPGSVSRALGINKGHNGSHLSGNRIWIEDRGISYQKSQIIASPRVGVAYAGEDALLPWRYRVKGNPWAGKDTAPKSPKGT